MLKCSPPGHGGEGWLRPWQFKRRLVGVRATARARWHKATSKRGRSFDSTPRVDPLGPGKAIPTCDHGRTVRARATVRATVRATAVRARHRGARATPLWC